MLASFILKSLFMAQALHEENGVKKVIFHVEKEAQNGTFMLEMDLKMDVKMVSKMDEK